MRRIVVATNNSGKLREIQELLASSAVEALPQSGFRVPEVDETGQTFVENAILKARNAAQHTGLPAIGDDSGLEVDALQGRPGIHSSRYSGDHATDRENRDKLLAALKEVDEPHRGARFQCVLVFLRHALDPTPLICQGTWEGFVLTSAKGEGGFGYDPIFWVPDCQRSAAELTADEKNLRSHRGQALRQFMQRIPSLVAHD